MNTSARNTGKISNIYLLVALLGMATLSACGPSPLADGRSLNEPPWRTKSWGKRGRLTGVKVVLASGEERCAGADTGLPAGLLKEPWGEAGLPRGMLKGGRPCGSLFPCLSIRWAG